MPTECNRCLLTAEIPGVTFDSKGLCSVCVQYDATWGNWNQVKSQKLQELKSILEAAKKAKRPYDVLVPLSGGKDSCFVLFVMRRHFGMKCLAVTFDNGFLSEHARQNIKNATSALDTDHTYFQISRSSMMQTYRSLFLKTGMFCPACMLGISYAIDMAAASFRIPLIAGGTSSRTEEYVAPEFFVADDIHFFRAAMEEESLLAHTGLNYRGDWRRRLPSHVLDIKGQIRYAYGAKIDLPDYYDWDYAHIYSTIKRELGWVSRTDMAEHADCTVEPLVHYLRQRRFPALKPELLRFSKLITIGVMTKEEARRKLEKPATHDGQKHLPLLLDSLQLSEGEFEAVISDPLRHMQYVEKASQSRKTLQILDDLRRQFRG
jgi:hypothetical protein